MVSLVDFAISFRIQMHAHNSLSRGLESSPSISSLWTNNFGFFLHFNPQNLNFRLPSQSKIDICELLKKSGNGRILSYDTMVPNIEYLKSCGICPLQITRYVCSYLPLYLSNSEKLKGYVKRVDELGVPWDSKMFLPAIKVIASLTRENWEFKLKLFRDLGFSEQNISHAFRIAPVAFALSESKIKETTQILLSVADISYVAKKPHLLTYSVEKRLKPRLRVLKALESKNLINRRPILTLFLQITGEKFVDLYVSPYSEEVGDLYEGKQCS